jgi:HK97 gp10 family phage protein
MATRVKVSTKGFEEYLEKLANAGRDVDESVQKALIAGANVAQKGMQKRVRKKEHNLEKHIQIDGPHQDGNFSYVDVGVIPKKSFTDADTARYGNAQEYGTSSMEAQPYIRPTMKEDAGKIRKAIKNSLIEDGVIE